MLFHGKWYENIWLDWKLKCVNLSNWKGNYICYEGLQHAQRCKTEISKTLLSIIITLFCNFFHSTPNDELVKENYAQVTFSWRGEVGNPPPPWSCKYLIAWEERNYIGKIMRQFGLQAFREMISWIMSGKSDF